jgi:hypothetical protein
MKEKLQKTTLNAKSNYCSPRKNSVKKYSKAEPPMLRAVIKPHEI